MGREIKTPSAFILPAFRMAFFELVSLLVENVDCFVYDNFLNKLSVLLYEGVLRGQAARVVV